MRQVVCIGSRENIVDTYNCHYDVLLDTEAGQDSELNQDKCKTMKGDVKDEKYRIVEGMLFHKGTWDVGIDTGA